MTNETASVLGEVAEKVADGFASHVDEGRTFLRTITDWLAVHGVAYAMDMAIAAATLFIGMYVIRFISAAAAKAFTRNGKKRTLISDFASSVVSKGCWAILIIMVLGRLGVNVAPLIAGLGVTGFILGFAFQESLGNLASGLMIALNDPFKVGDFVEIAGKSGTILEVNMMATVLATPDNKKIVVPNKSVWGGAIVNYAALGKRRVDIDVGIAYGENIQRAVDIAAAAVRTVPGVLDEPAPRIEPVSFDDSAVTLCVRPWCAAADYWSVHAATLKAVKDAFERASISIPFPQLDIHVEGGLAGGTLAQ